MLHPIGRVIPMDLSEVPPVFPFYRAEQASQLRPHTPPHVPPRKPGVDLLLHLCQRQSPCPHGVDGQLSGRSAGGWDHLHDSIRQKMTWDETILA